MNKNIFKTVMIVFLASFFLFHSLGSGNEVSATTIDGSYYGSDYDEEAHGYGHDHNEEHVDKTNISLIITGSVIGVGIITILIVIANKKSSP